ncbi:MAG: MCP four helix bundle domain-containing protein [Betaproteobacteria bacterium]|nr:MCP four helix bundle domain-containing protein [Betaproteobacteria bacterium]
MESKSIKSQLTSLVAVLTVFLLAVVLLAVEGMRHIESGLRTVYEDRVIPMQQIANVRYAYSVRVMGSLHQLEAGRLSWDQAAANIGDAEANAAHEWKAYLGTFLTEEEKRLIAEYEPLARTRGTVLAKANAMIKAGDMDTLKRFIAGEIYPAVESAAMKLGELSALQEEVTKQVYEDAAAAYRMWVRIFLLLLLLGAGVGAGIGMAVMRRVSAPIVMLQQAAERLAQGDLTARAPTQGNHELGQLAGAFNAMAESLQGIAAERKQTEQAREHLVRDLELLSERLAMTQEEERRKITYALHEELGQELAALKVYVEMSRPDGGMGPGSPLDVALTVTTHAMERIRKLVLDLDSQELEDFGLHAAMRNYCGRETVVGGWNMHIDAPTIDVQAPRPVERACFRVLQEALRNVLHHAQASEVWVELHQRAGELELGIRDNGIGFDPNAVRDEKKHEGGSQGLLLMQIRAKQVGGSVEIKSTAGAGTEIRVVFRSDAALA